MSDPRPVLIAAIATFVGLVAAGLWFSSQTPEWLTAHSPEHWPLVVQVAVSVVLGAVLLMGLLLWGAILWGGVTSVKDEVKHARANHRFANESTAERIVVARYNVDGDRDTVLDVALNEKRLWLAPSTGADSFSAWQYVALLDHAPLYRRNEGDLIEDRNDLPFLDCAHKPLWTGDWDNPSKSNVAHRQAIQQAIDAGAVTLHVTPHGWEPAIPADAKFRTSWTVDDADPAAA
ncbi:hypothetical protein [Curtobacterium sp. MCSS17_016]|uniref:hypothetical protein n=1 Tax=Curtobacterium sp. MCSS17_016 TaxID=2175644 RepID=UPI0011B379B9|nr:hypothetical protein [Curtobacterium sp. MCSS17_016]WIE81059.1 hypothetical protein DEJ19_021315 [Curtobacterium sp. MCSS17_016]